MGKEEKAMRYVQDKMFPYIINASRITDPCFTRDDLRKAYESGYDEGYSEGRTENLLDQLKKNKDEEAELICKRKQDEAWTEFKKIFYNMETKEDKAKKYAEGLNKVGQSFDIYYVEQAFLDGWEECMKYLQSLPLDEASNRILYHGTKIGDKSTFND